MLRLVCHSVVQVLLMDLVPDDKARGLTTPIWEEYKKIVNNAEEREVGTVVGLMWE